MARRHFWIALALPLVAGLCACSDDRKPVPEEAPAAGTASSPGLSAPGSAGMTGGATAAPAKGGVMLKVGDEAPDFKATDHTGKVRSLAEFRGKRTVLWFYPKASTGG